MKKYQIQNSIGSGNFSTVFKGIIHPDQSPCAIKIMKSHHKIAVRQAQLLRKLKHPNVISMIDFEQTQNESRLILQYVGINTLELYQSHSYGLRQEQVKCILFQVALGLSCVHSFGIIHRDIKPENILIDKKMAMVKLIDFGLAIDQNQVSTDYIATRWYRAPENLLGTKQYTCAIDVFSLGCVIVQLYLGSPLFPGQNNIDQIYKIFNILGYPNPVSWPRGYEKMMQLGIRVNSHQKKTQIDLKSIMNPCDPRLVDIVQKMLQFNPKNRITCAQILKHQYFKDIKSIIPPMVFKRYQQDFLMNKSLNFKGFQPAKSSKNNSSQIVRKFPQINFHNVSSKLKHPQIQNLMQNQLKVVQKPQFLRQKKSSSLDSCFPNQSANETDKKVSHLPPKASTNPQINNMVINRKLSTPSLVSHLRSPQAIQKNQNSTLQTKSKQIGEQGFKKNLSDIKINIQTIAEQTNHQKTFSTVVPESSQTAPSYSHSHLSKNVAANTSDSQPRQFRPFYVPEITRNSTYPFIPNVQLVSQQYPQQNNYKIPMRIMSPPVNMSYNQDQSFNSSVNYTEQQKKPVNFVTKTFQLTQNHQKPLMSQQFEQNINSSIYRSFENQPNRNYIESLVKQDLNKKAKNMQITLPQPLQPITPRQNYVSPLNNIRRPEQSTSRPQIIYRSPNNTEVISKPFLSPTHRFAGNTSPDNSFNMNRQRRLVAVNSPIIQSPNSFYSPNHRKF